jgi:hypothetical protein
MSKRQPNVEFFIDGIDQQLREAIETCEKSSLGKISFLDCNKKFIFDSSRVKLLKWILKLVKH